jgi:hypothetical protein
MLLGYFAVYVLTPANLHDHLVSSLERLFLHLWPAFLLLVGLAMPAAMDVDRSPAARPPHLTVP